MKKKSILVGTVALGLITATSLYSCNPADKKTATPEASADAKCGEGKCGSKKDSAMTSEGKCGDSAHVKTAEGKCGEGKCGDKKK